MKKTTLKDIALAAGVSVDTVSRVLNGKAKGKWASSADKIERIQELARRLDYKPNKAAQFMRTQRTHQIGLIGSELYNPYTTHILETLGEELSRHGYNLLLGVLRSTGSQLTSALHDFSQNLLDGVIVVHPLVDSEQMTRHFGQLPSVIFNRSIADSPVAVSFAEGMNLALRHLWDLGHRRIALLTSDANVEDRRRRLQSFEAFFTSMSTEMKPEWIIHTGWRYEDGEASCDQFLETQCTACLAGNDLLAVALCLSLRVRGIEVPGTYSIVSMDDTILAKINRPQLTSLRPPIAELVHWTVESLLAMIDERPLPRHRALLPELIVRQSTAAPPHPDR